MSKKMGRPTSDPKIHDTRVKFSDKDLEMLEFCASYYGITKAEAVRRGVKTLYEKAKRKEKRK